MAAPSRNLFIIKGLSFPPWLPWRPSRCLWTGGTLAEPQVTTMPPCTKAWTTWRRKRQLALSLFGFSGWESLSVIVNYHSWNNLRKIKYQTLLFNVVNKSLRGRQPVWPDLAKFRHYGKFVMVYFLFGKMLSLHWQICDISRLIFIVAKYWKTI